MNWYKISQYNIPTQEDYLVVAIEDGNLAYIDAILESGAYVNSRMNASNDSILIFACMRGNVNVVKHLVEKSVDDIGAVDLAQALGRSLSFRNFEIAEYLISIGNFSWDAIIRMPAIALESIGMSEDIQVSKSLIEKLSVGLGFDFKNRILSEALMGACSFGNLELSKYLIDNGADVNHDEGKALIEVAASRSISVGVSIELVDLLVENGLDLYQEYEDPDAEWGDPKKPLFEVASWHARFGHLTDRIDEHVKDSSPFTGHRRTKKAQGHPGQGEGSVVRRKSEMAQRESGISKKTSYMQP